MMRTKKGLYFSVVKVGKFIIPASPISIVISPRREEARQENISL
jgi:hypothetical protein